MNVTELEKYSKNDYRDMLDEVYGDIDVCGFTFSASYALEKLDPVAFKCGFVDSQEYVYECGECSEVYNNEDDAEECCKEKMQTLEDVLDYMINADNDLDMSNLPVFDDIEKINTVGVWSIDERRAIIGDDASDFRIVPRCKKCGEVEYLHCECK